MLPVSCQGSLVSTILGLCHQFNDSTFINNNTSVCVDFSRRKYLYRHLIEKSKNDYLKFYFQKKEIFFPFYIKIMDS